MGRCARVAPRPQEGCDIFGRWTTIRGRSAVLADDPRTLPCASPATRIFAEVSTALGHTFTPNPER